MIRSDIRPTSVPSSCARVPETTARNCLGLIGDLDSFVNATERARFRDDGGHIARPRPREEIPYREQRVTVSVRRSEKLHRSLCFIEDACGGCYPTTRTARRAIGVARAAGSSVISTWGSESGKFREKIRRDARHPLSLVFSKCLHARIFPPGNFASRKNRGNESVAGSPVSRLFLFLFLLLSLFLQREPGLSRAFSFRALSERIEPDFFHFLDTRVFPRGISARSLLTSRRSRHFSTETQREVRDRSLVLCQPVPTGSDTEWPMLLGDFPINTTFTLSRPLTR